VRQLRKIFAALALLVVYSIAAWAAPGLPDIEGWTNGKARVTELQTDFKNRGRWIERDYRTDGGVLVHAVWMEGSGERGWNVADGDISADDGPLGSGAVYRTIRAAGEKAILERHPVMGCSIAARVGTLGVLTLESKSATDEEMIQVAETLILKIKSDTAAQK